jgi:TolB-like protein/DNA-binding winged helix-turn-helix (wHTH) protein/tetratricopeptide (TPR) repeat protein
VRFGTFEVDFRAGELRKNGIRVKLHNQPMAVLEMLLEQPGEVVTREEIQQKLWGSDTFVDFEQGLNKAMNKLRDALSDSAESPRYIETLPRRGYRFIGPVARPEAEVVVVPPQPAPRFLDGKKTLVAAVVILVAAAAVFWLGRRHSSPQPPSRRAMLAVLPFENLSGDSGEDYFADGLTEEMIAQLGQLRPSSLGVIARTSSMRYKHTRETVAQIGRELGVNYVLEGSVRRAGQRVRITAQLIQASDQTHLWAESYEQPLTDILNIQREIAERITGSLQLELLPGHAADAANERFDPDAYRKYLLARNEFRSGTREGARKAVAYLQEAIAADPNNGRLYAALGEVYAASHTFYGTPREVMPQAKDAALKALELDPSLASAHATLGYVSLFFDWDWKRAESEYLRALEMNPSMPDAQLGYASYLATLGRFDEAIARVQQAYLVDPLAAESRSDALWIYYFSGRLLETVEQAQKTIEMEPQSALPHALLALADADLRQRAEAVRAAEEAVRLSEGGPSLVATAASAMARAGERDKASQVLDHALELAKREYVCRFIIAGAYVDLGETEKAFDSLELAFRQRST